MEQDSSATAAPAIAAAPAKVRNWPYVIFALLSGGAAAYLHVQLGELGLAALVVAASTMFLGAMRPRRPWMWALLVALTIPALELVAYLHHEYFGTGATFGSLALLIPAFACAYGGAVGQRLLRELFAK